MAPMRILSVAFVFSKLAQSLITIAHDFALTSACSIVPLVVFGDQFSVTVSQPRAVKPADDAAGPVPDVIVIHIC
jgi:hypothetical protein